MRRNLLICAAALGLAAVRGLAQQSRADLLASLGLERSSSGLVYTRSVRGVPVREELTADQSDRVEDFLSRVCAAPDQAAVLDETARAALIDAGRPTNLPAPDGALWFADSGGTTRLTGAGLRALPGVILGDPFGVAARSASASAHVASTSFDAALPDAPTAVAPEAGATGLTPPGAPSAPRAAAVPTAKPARTAFEKTAFWSTWYGYHAAWAADFTSTGMILGRGGYEEDHLYTQFGNKNMAGVIGSAAAVHVAASAASLALYEKAGKEHGWKRVVLDAAALAINSYGIGAHVQGVTHNAGVMSNWNTR
jgi:hypothetical protein